MTVGRYGAQLAATGRFGRLLPAARDREAGGPAIAGEDDLARTRVAGTLVAPGQALVILRHSNQLELSSPNSDFIHQSNREVNTLIWGKSTNAVRYRYR